MAFVIDTRGTPTPQSRLSESFSKGFDVGLQYKLSELMKQKQIEREGLQNEKINQELYGIKSQADPQQVGNFYKLMIEHGGTERANRARAIAAGLPAGVPAPIEMTPEKLPKTIDPNAPIPEVTAPESKIPQYEPGSAKDLENRRAQVIEAYNKENDPIVKKEIFDTIKYLNDQVLKQRTQEMEKEKFSFKKEESQYKHHQDLIERNEKISTPYLTEISKKERLAANQEIALEAAENAIRNGDTSSVMQAIAQRLNLLPGQTPDAAILNAAAKEFLFTNISRIGARPNMYVEQQVRSMFPQVGQSKEAALSVLEVIKNDNAINIEEAKIARQVEDEYKAQGLDYIPKEIEKEVNKKLLPYIDHKKKVLARSLRMIEEEKYSDSDLDSMTTQNVRSGTPLTDRMGYAILRKSNGDTKKARKIAKKLGYEIPGEGK